MDLSFIIPTYNAETYIGKVLKSIIKQNYSLKKIEIIIVDDNSTDNTISQVKSFGKYFPNLKVVVKDYNLSKGAAISTNIGIKQSKGKFICLVDSDAVLGPKWIEKLMLRFSDSEVGMVAGVIKTANSNNMWAALIGKELEDRYEMIDNAEVDHLSTCNTIYKRKLFDRVGFFNEKLYYGYDVELSYLVRKEGYKILLVKDAYCKHYWKDTFSGLVKQLFNTGYARLKILEGNPDKKVGGQVSGWKLMLQVPITLILVIALPASFLDINFLYLSLMLFICILIIQLPQTSRIVSRTKDYRLLLFPVVMLLRNIIWAWAVIVYSFKELPILGRIK